MPRNAPKVTFGRGSRSPSERQREKAPRTSDAFKPPMKKPTGLSEIAEYVEENKEYRDTTLELIREFQQEECEHTKARILISSSPSKKFLKCPDCGDIKVEEKKQ